MDKLNPTLLIARNEPTCCELVERPTPALGEGGVLLRTEHLAITANTVTYATISPQMPYLDFFPLEGDDPQRNTHGVLPAWGHAVVEQSRHPGVAVGHRFFGIWPAARFAALQPAAFHATGLRVDRPHLPADYGVYHGYHRTDLDPFHQPGRDREEAVLRPLLVTGLLLADYLGEHELFGARFVVVSAASSKTAYGVAAGLRAEGTLDVLGLTARANLEVAASFGLYERLVAYDEIATMAQLPSIVFVDIAGNRNTRETLRALFGDRLVRRIAVGTAHFDPAGLSCDSTDPTPTETFFAPGWAAQRQRELGTTLGQRLLSGWRFQMAGAPRHFPVDHRYGPAALAEAFREILSGRASAGSSLVITV